MNAKPNNRLNGVEKQEAPILCDSHFELPAAAPEERLAAGILAQAGRDLRRFQAATRGIEREIYLDAYGWITANDFSWPYSFVNICQLLHLCPEITRAELLEGSLAGRRRFPRLREGLSNLLHLSLMSFSRGLVAQTENS